MKPVLDLFPQSGAFQAFFHPLRDEILVPDPVDAQAVCNVVMYGFREGVGFLEYHAYPPSDIYHINVRIVHILAVHQYLAGGFCPRDHVVHPVYASEKGRLSAARGPYYARDAIAVNIHRDVLDGKRIAVVKIKVRNFDLDVRHFILSWLSSVCISGQQRKNS